MNSENINKSQKQPNIILFLADDLGWTDLSCYGSQYYETPRIDAFANESCRFTSNYACAANCSPSRACLISGQYVPRHGVYTVSQRERFPGWEHRKIVAPQNSDGWSHDLVSMPKALKTAGYTTGMFGKWHISYNLAGKPGQAPENFFDESVTLKNPKHFEFEVNPPASKPLSKDHYLSDYLATQAIDFMERNQEEPFFLFLPDFLVHVPLEAKQEQIDKYKAKKPAGGHDSPVYAAMVESLDISFGRILDAVEKLNLAEDTIIVFTSDNGGAVAPNLTSNLPLRGTKGQLYEGGIRVPLIMHVPGSTKAKVCDEPVIGADLYPTFLDAANANPPENHALDGESLMPLFAGQKFDRKDQGIFWWMPGYLPGRQTPACALRSGDWKLIHFFEDDHYELYNLTKDIAEHNNLTESHPEILANMIQTMKNIRAKTGAQTPPHNPNYTLENDPDKDTNPWQQPMTSAGEIYE